MCHDLSMHISISSKCVGCGACALINPEIFEINKNFAVVNPNFISGNEESCIDAAIECPVNAISVYG